MQTKTFLTHGLVTATPRQLVEFGQSRGWYFQIMEEKGVLTEKVQKTQAATNTLWVYEPDSNINITPQKEIAYKMLDEVWKADFPIKQVIYGYQVKPDKKPVKLPQIKVSPDTVKFASAVVVGSAMLVAGAASLVLYGIVMALAADPLLAVVLDTGEEEKDLPWVCLYSWDD